MRRRRPSSRARRATRASLARGGKGPKSRRGHRDALGVVVRSRAWLCASFARRGCRRRDGLRRRRRQPAGKPPASSCPSSAASSFHPASKGLTLGRADATAASASALALDGFQFAAAGGQLLGGGARGVAGRLGTAAQVGQAWESRSLGLAQGLGEAWALPGPPPPESLQLLQVAHAGEHAGSSSTTAPPRSPPEGHDGTIRVAKRRAASSRPWAESPPPGSGTPPHAQKRLHGAPVPLPGRGARPRADAIGPAGSLAPQGAAPDGGWRRRE